MSLARDTVGQFRDDPGHSGTVGKPNYFPSVKQYLKLETVQHNNVAIIPVHLLKCSVY